VFLNKCQIDNPHFEDCQVKVKAEVKNCQVKVKENLWSFPYFSYQPQPLLFFLFNLNLLHLSLLNLNLNLNLVKIRITDLILSQKNGKT
jgi:hypothetical protein